MENRATQRFVDRLLMSIARIRAQCLEFERRHAAEVEAVHPDYRASARNLLHYLAVRQHDIREVQEDLASLGLSSLGRLESHTLATLNAVFETLRRLSGKPDPDLSDAVAPAGFRTGPLYLRDHANRLLGPESGSRGVRIMVTMPSEAAEDETLIYRLVKAGMSIMRVNCAHDGPEAWAKMVANLRRAEAALGRKCRILADLGGPKLRTGPIEPAGHVVRFNPPRDINGFVSAPATIWLTPAESPEPEPEDVDGVLPVVGDLLDRVAPGDALRIADCRGMDRTVTVIEAEGRSRLAHTLQGLYAAGGAAIRRVDGDAVVEEGRIGSVPPVIQPLVLYRGDILILTHDHIPGRPAVTKSDGTVAEPAQIGCSLASVFACAKRGERIWFDDGKIGGTIRAVASDAIRIEITTAGPKGSKLRPEKGINLPDTDLATPALTDKDLGDLRCVARLVDMVGLSFVRRPEDVDYLVERLGEIGAQHLGIVLKIENRTASERLPELMLSALKSPPVGVMVARGDLAVEVGFGRLAELQEEILWLCEAAHVPVIWATQVLEDMAKTGMPSRAEVTDAAMSSRAECVMLNKGPYITDAVSFLDGILSRMDDHQTKKTSMLRKLNISFVSK